MSNVSLCSPLEPFTPGRLKAPSPAQPVTVTVLNDWIRKCASALPRCEGIEKNGIYPLLEKR